MARQITLLSDVDGKTVATQTVTMTITVQPVNGEARSITVAADLSNADRKALDASLATFRKASHVVTPATAPRGNRPSRSYNPADVRAWAATQGIKTGERGRFSDELLTAYAAAGSPSK